MNYPLTLNITKTAKRVGIPRTTIALLCARGEIAYNPTIRPDGSRSRIHKQVIQASVDEWIEKNAVRCPEDLRKAVDGRRK